MSDQPRDPPHTPADQNDHTLSPPAKRKRSSSPQKESPASGSIPNDKNVVTTPLKKQASPPVGPAMSPTSPTLRCKPSSSVSPLTEQESPAKKQSQSPQKDAKENTTKSPTQKETPSKRQKSPPQRASVKRQRRQVEKYESPLPAQDTPSTPSSVKLYDKSTTLAVRADGGTFYLCRTVAPVYNTHGRFKVRWFEVEQAPDLYRLAYEDRIELECVIGPAILQRTTRGLFRLTPPELERINQLLNAAEKGADVTKLDPALFKPQKEGVKLSTSSQNDDTDVEIEEPPKKTRKRAERTETPRTKRASQTPKESTGRKPRTPRSETPRASASRGGRGRKRVNLRKIVSIETAAPTLRRTTTMPIKAVVQRKSSFVSRPSLLRRISLQRWPSLKLKGRKLKREPGKPRPPLDPNRKLKHNPRVTVWEKDPLFESRETVPFVSTTMHSRLAIRAAMLNDIGLMESAINDRKQIHSVEIQKSLHSTTSAMKLAIKHENHDMLKLLANERREEKGRAASPTCLLETMDTGRYNPRALPGVKAVRKIQMSRGGKEGNNALVKDASRTYSPSPEDYAGYALQDNISEPTIELLCATGILTKHSVYSNIHEAVRAGHRKLAAKLMENSEQIGGYGFNFMHKESLKFDGENYTGKMLEASVRKKPVENKTLGPLHCAAINPNTKYLSELLAVLPEINIKDGDQRRPIHYAAACEGTGPLEMLIKKGASLEEGNSKGWTPLIIACITGRPDNVRLILKELIEKEKELKKGTDAFGKPGKFGFGGINRPMKSSWCPIHFAVANQHQNVVEILVEHGADVNKHLNANFNRITPLMMAAQDGNLELVKFLISKYAVIEKPDKLKRTALTHAIRDGNAMVASYLLNLGANPNVTDSSGNTVLHYAAAYGWYFCMNVLLNAGAQPDPSNDWKLTPMGVSYMKGHHGLTKILMDIPGVDINFQDDNGCTLVHQALKKHPIKRGTLTEVRMLVEDKKANANLLDKEGRNLFSYLIRHELPNTNTWTYADDSVSFTEALEQAKEASIAIADFLLEKGCNPWLKDNSGQGNLLKIMQQSKAGRNIDLLYHILDAQPHFDDLPNSEETGQTILHWLCEHCEDGEMFTLIKKVAALKFEDGTTGLQMLRKMAKVRKKNTGFGETPLALVAKCYTDCAKHWMEIDEEYQGRLGRHRDLMQYLIEELGSEIEYVYEYKDKDTTKTYKWTLLTHVLSVAKQDMDKGFQMVLKYKPTIDFILGNGHTPLLAMVVAGASHMVKLLLDAEADVNFKSRKKEDGRMTPALLAVSEGNAALMADLLGRGAHINDVKEDTGSSLLHLAVLKLGEQPALKTVRLLLKRGLDINVRDKKLRTVLHLLANKSTDSADEDTELEQVLLKQGADPCLKDIQGRLPIHYLFVKIGRHRDSTRIDPVETYSIFSMAMKNQHLDDADVFGQTVLHRAAYRGATVCSMLLMQKGAEVNAKDKDGNTPLSLAVWQQHDSCVLMLMQKGADISLDVVNDPLANVPPEERARLNKEKELEQNGPVNANGSSDSEASSEEGHSEKCVNSTIRENIRRIKEKPAWKLLKRHFPTKWQPGKRGYPIFQGLVLNDWQGLTFLAMDLLEPFGVQYAAAVEIAIVLEKFRFALKLMAKQLDDAKLQVVNDRKQNLLHVLAAKTSTTNKDLQNAIAQRLVEERKLKVNDCDEDGFTALHYAILHNNWNIADYLLSCEGVDLNLKDKFGRPPIAGLLWNPQNSPDQRACLQKMLKNGANADLHIDYPPTSIVHCGYKPDLESTDYHQRYSKRKTTPLINAIIHRCPHTVKTLLDQGASRNFADEEGVTPLMYAAVVPDSLYCELLITKCLDIEHRTQEKILHNQSVRDGTVPKPVRTDSDLFAGIKTFVKDSDVDIDAVDNKGRSALHHLIEAIPYATYEDVEILKLLSNAGAELNVKDKMGFTPCDLALKKGGLTLVKALQTLKGGPPDKLVLPTLKPMEVDDGITWNIPMVDFQADAEAMLRKMEEEEEKVMEKLPRAVTDSRIGISSCEVVMDEEIDMPYDILMTKVDVRVGEYGLYNFYKMQVVRDTEKDLYLLFNCWGRIGDGGQYQRTPFKSDKEAFDEFAKIFKAKSGNEWKNVKNFEVKPLKYRLVDADYRQRNKKPDVRFNLTSKIPSKLPPYLQDMISELSNIAMLNNSMEKTGMDVPFGRLKKDNLQKACTILQDLSDLAEKVDQLERNLTTHNLEDYRLVCQQVSDLSTEYYYLVPQRSYAFERLVPLKKKGTVQRHITTLSDLLELQHAGSIMLAAQYRIKEMNPLDYIYRALNISIQQLSMADQEVSTICRYVYADNSDRSSWINIEAVYRIELKGEPERLMKCGLDNHMMLWHGSRTSNLVSILSKGLLIAPREAPSSGSLFNKGIYMADSFAKSTGYCHNYGGGRSKFMLLTEVALGAMKDWDTPSWGSLSDILPEGYSSVKGNGRMVPDPACRARLPTGAVIPLGGHVENFDPYVKVPQKDDYRWSRGTYSRSLNYNEYIVYKEEQVCLRYIVQFH